MSQPVSENQHVLLYDEGKTAAVINVNCLGSVGYTPAANIEHPRGSQNKYSFVKYTHCSRALCATTTQHGTLIFITVVRLSALAKFSCSTSIGSDTAELNNTIDSF